MDRRRIATDKAPQAIGPYSQAIYGGVFIYTSGQVAIDPATGRMIDDADISGRPGRRSRTSRRFLAPRGKT